MRYSKAVLKSFIFFVLLVCGYGAKSQTVVTIGTGTASISEKYPFNDFYNYSWSNVIYLSSEIGQGGQITKVGFNVYNNSTVTMTNQKIYARHTTATSYTTGTYPGTSGFTLIYDGSITYSGAGWKTITLTTPFTYNGTDNLELLFENRNGSYSSNFPYFYVTTGYSSNRARRDYQDASFPSSCVNCAAVTNIPNTQLTIGCSTTMSVTPTTVSICNGSSTTLSASGVSSYTWSPSSGLNTTTSASVTASPTATTVYSVTGTDANSCTQTKTVTVTVNSLPTLTISPSSGTICSGSSQTFTASGASTYTWSPTTGLNTSTGATVTASPTTTITYTVTGTNSNSCVNTKTVTLTVNPVNSITITPGSASICTGSSTSLVASGAQSYTWAPGTGLNTTTSATVTANPTVTTTYTVTGNCGQIQTIVVTVNSLPSLTVTPSSATICVGVSRDLLASGASTYTWSPATGLNTTNGSSVVASPTATTTYTVTGTDANGCVNTKTDVITVNSLPSLTITPSSSTICAGGSTNLTASGASTYTWSPSSSLSAATGATVTATPTATTTYTINATGSNGCTNSTTAVVTVNSNPSISISPTSTTVCNGGSTSLTASGANTYTWSPSTGLNTTTGATVTANPTGTIIYTVTGTSSGCNGTTTTTVSVAFVNAGTALASGGTDPCSNGQVALSLTGTKTTTVGTGTATSVNYPFNGFYNYSWSDVIYLQSDLGAAGSITKLSFYVDNAPSNYTMTTQQIYIKSTSATSFSSGTYPGTSGFTQVFNGTITYNGSGWKTITLSTPFSYDGTSNIEILYENHDGSWTSGYPVFRYTVGSAARTRRDFSDASFPSSCVSCATTLNVPNTQFTIDRTLGTFVKWQSSTDNVTYTDVTGGTTQNYTTTVGTSSYFRAQVTSGSCPAAYSDPVYYATKNRYYVNDNSISGDVFTTAVGSSSNDGKDKARPKASINAIITTYTLGPCDTIFVDKGNYTEEVDVFFGDGGNSSGYTVIHGAGIDQSVLTAPTNKYNMYLGQPDYIKVEGFTMNSTQASYPNVDITEAENNILSGNKFTHSAMTNIQVFGDNLDANNNQIVNNIITNSSTGGNGVLVWGNVDNLTIATNTITMSNASSQDAILVTTYTVAINTYYPGAGSIDHNTISAYSYGVSLWGYDHPISTYTISNNTITLQNKTTSDGAPVWISGVGSTSSDQTIVYNNRLIGGKNGIYLGASADYTKIYNNYISNNDYGLYDASASSDIGELYFNSFYNQITNLYFTSTSNGYWKVKNNILYTTNSTNTNACISVGSGITFVACDYNLFYAPSGASIGRFNGTNYSSLSTWQNIDHADETTKGDEHSLYGNPIYSNPSQNNLDLTGLSPADIDGVSISGITTDIYNHTRFSPPNIGAEEEIPVANAGPDVTICQGSSTQLSGSGGLAYSWAPTTGLSNPNIANPIASPTVTTNYTLTVTDGNESTTDVVVVNVNQLPIVVIAPSSPAICQGNSTTLTASGASTYSWSGGTGLSTTSGSVVTANPTVSTVYTVTGTDQNGCVNTMTVLVTVNQLPVITVNSPTICFGSSATITASGASSYSWAPSTGLNTTTGSVVVASPTVSSVYTVTGTSESGCSSIQTSSVTIKDTALIVTIISSDGDNTICVGGEIVLSAFIESNYNINSIHWNTGSTSDSLFVTQAGTYSVTATDSLGCSGSASVDVTILSNPTIDATVDSSSVCAGGTVQLNATGADNYYWYPSLGLNDALISSPVAKIDSATKFYVIGEIGNCQAIDSVTISVWPSPVLTANQFYSICNGSSVTLTASGAGSFTWQDDTTTYNQNSLTVSPLSSSSYNVTLTSNHGCSVSQTVNVEVINVNFTLPADTLYMNTGDIKPINVFSPYGTSFTWSPKTGLSDSTVQNPVCTAAQSINYTLTVSDSTCTQQKTMYVKVLQKPRAAFTFSTSNLDAQFFTLGDPYSTYDWDFGDGTTASGASMTHTFPSSGFYIVKLKVTNSLGQDMYYNKVCIRVN